MKTTPLPPRIKLSNSTVSDVQRAKPDAAAHDDVILAQSGELPPADLKALKPGDLKARKPDDVDRARQASVVGKTHNVNIDSSANSAVPLSVRLRAQGSTVDCAAEGAKLQTLIAWAERKGAGRTQLHESGDLFDKPLLKLWNTLHSEEVEQRVKADPFLVHLHEQVTMNLRHVRMDAPGGRCAFEPSLAGLKNARDFFDVLGVGAGVKLTVPGSPAEIQSELLKLEQEDSLLAKSIIAAPMKHYQEYAARISAHGDNAKFPEFDKVTRILSLRASSESILELCAQHPHLAQLREVALQGLQEVALRGCPYRETIDAIQRAVAFFDVYERGRPGSTPTPLYHSRRWQYHAHIMKAEVPQHILFPTQHPLGVSDLIKVRGVPLGLMGVVTEQHYADGFYQSPLEFWFHDINHSRRMWQQLNDRAAELGMTVDDYAKMSNDFIWQEIVPLVAFTKADPEDHKNLRRLIKVLLFEILHEDALPADRALLSESLGRRPFAEGRFVFETLSADQSAISYARAPNAAVTAIVFRKLEGEFYDVEGMRINALGSDQVRNREMIARAAILANDKLGLGLDAEILRANVIDDSGLPLDLRAKVIKRMHDRPDNTLPLVEDAAMRDWVNCGERRGSVPFFVGKAAKGQEQPVLHPLVGATLEPLRAFVRDEVFTRLADQLEDAVARLRAGDKTALAALARSEDRSLRRLSASLTGAGAEAVDDALWHFVKQHVAGIANSAPLLSADTDALLLGNLPSSPARLHELSKLPLLSGMALQYAKDALPQLDELLQKSARLTAQEPSMALASQGFVEVKSVAKDGRFFRADDGRFASLIAGKLAAVGLGDVLLPLGAP